MTADILNSFVYLLSPVGLGWTSLGVLLGVIVGAIPGLGGGMLMALMIPATFAMEGLDAQIFLIGIYVGGVSGSMVSAILLGVPGAPSAIMTVLDGHSMAKKGLAERSLSIGIMSSFMGGLFSWAVLIMLAIPLSVVATSFRSFDYFSLVTLGLVLIAYTGSGSMIKALMMGMVGFFVSTVGIDDITAGERFTFDTYILANGFHLLPVLLGAFAVRQVLANLTSPALAQSGHAKATSTAVIFRELGRAFRYKITLIRSSIIGTWVGLLPGIGANIGAIMSYSAAKSLSREKDKFGHGAEEGVVAAEAGNNATVGGALIPMISLGIPGSGQDVILLAVLILHGVEPGPLLVLEHSDVFYGIITAYLMANVAMLFVMLFSIRFLAKVIHVPQTMLAPAVLTFCVVGAISVNNNTQDAWVMLAFGLAGVLMSKFEFPIAPFIIGFVLGPLAEVRLRSALMSTDGDFMPFLERPIGIAALTLCAAILLWPLAKAVFLRLRSHQRDRRI